MVKIPHYNYSLVYSHHFKEVLYVIWCGVNILGDSVVNTLGDTSAFVNPADGSAIVNPAG